MIRVRRLPVLTNYTTHHLNYTIYIQTRGYPVTSQTEYFRKYRCNAKGKKEDEGERNRNKERKKLGIERNRICESTAQ
jgi:hypothetical protein